MPHAMAAGLDDGAHMISETRAYGMCRFVWTSHAHRMNEVTHTCRKVRERHPGIEGWQAMRVSCMRSKGRVRALSMPGN